MAASRFRISNRAATALIAGCYAICIAWVAFLGLAVALALMALLEAPYPRLVWMLVGSMALLTVATIAMAPAAITIRCPNCSHHILTTSGRPPHAFARRLGFFPGYKVIVLDIISEREFVCYDCGERISVQA